MLVEILIGAFIFGVISAACFPLGPLSIGMASFVVIGLFVVLREHAYRRNRG